MSTPAAMSSLLAKIAVGRRQRQQLAGHFEPRVEQEFALHDQLFSSES